MKISITDIEYPGELGDAIDALIYLKEGKEDSGKKLCECGPADVRKQASIVATAVGDILDTATGMPVAPILP